MFQGPEKNMTTLRTLYYPALTDDDVKPGAVRCGAHSDYGTITLLFQDEMGGLEVSAVIFCILCLKGFIRYNLKKNGSLLNQSRGLY